MTLLHYKNRYIQILWYQVLSFSHSIYKVLLGRFQNVGLRCYLKAVSPSPSTHPSFSTLLSVALHFPVPSLCLLSNLPSQSLPSFLLTVQEWKWPISKKWTLPCKEFTPLPKYVEERRPWKEIEIKMTPCALREEACLVSHQFSPRVVLPRWRLSEPKSLKRDLVPIHIGRRTAFFQALKWSCNINHTPGGIGGFASGCHKISRLLYTRQRELE